MRRLLAVAVVITVAACPPPPPPKDAGGGGGSGNPDAPGGAGGGGGMAGGGGMDAMGGMGGGMDAAGGMGGCPGVPCPAGDLICSNGSCCVKGRANCSTGDPDCERIIDTNPTCSTSTELGSVSGDTGTPSPIIKTGTSEAFFHIKVTEDSTSDVPIKSLVKLTSPTAGDFDLYIRGPDCATVISSYEMGGEGGTETAKLCWGDVFASDDAYDLWIEVRYAKGVPCSSWTLTIQGNSPDVLGC